jgi:hypothetical protein
VAGSLNITLAVVVAVAEGEELEFPLLHATTKSPARNAPAIKKINQRVPVDVAEPCFAVTTFLPGKASHIRDRRKAGNRQGFWRETFIRCSHTSIRRQPLYDFQASARHYLWGSLQLTWEAAQPINLGRTCRTARVFPYHCVPTVVIDGEVNQPNSAQVGYAEALCGRL